MALQAYRWSCGDDCDCTQYVIERTTPHPVTRGFVNRERVWEGAFRSDTGNLTKQERAEDLRAFRAAAHRFGITLTRGRFGLWSGERFAPLSGQDPETAVSATVPARPTLPEERG